jgi:hypothetical protein
MSPTGKPAGSADDSDNSVEERIRSTPDEEAPHDVPDDKVIEKTLPTTTPQDKGRGRPA